MQASAQKIKQEIEKAEKCYSNCRSS